MTFFILLLIAFISIFSLPVILVQLQAKRLNAKITISEAFKLRASKSASEKLFKGLAIVQENNFNISLSDLETLHLAGGNPEKVMTALLKYRDIKSLSFQKLSALELAGLDYEASIEDSLKDKTLRIESLKIGQFVINYEAVFSNRIGLGLEENQNENLESKIIDRLTNFLMNWEGEDKLKMQHYILTNVLNVEYWDRILV
ncbi:flotillin-like FloA family protein [Flammeovirga yaeyamensis]|uniref:Flotillin-like FloA family protein n=2 Tax=Flammeovirga yaeyamensis TaxID=367791 RepID=A0AAX1NDA7_9BACT|nr:flotillin-like FloA family protein [Flammeovirga yaeyamensis]NMF33186.1 hypothetical protein [Flammeovirga yaeyamensis]QWG05534.1 flotillin-like FloA family protein [Flammeovirga yaeyamensis]